MSWKMFLMVSMWFFFLFSCSSPNTPVSAPVSSESRKLLKAFSEQDNDEMLWIAQNENHIEEIVLELRSIQWDSQPLVGTTDIQSIFYDDLLLQVTSDQIKFVELLGESYSDGVVDAESYQKTIRVIAAILDGILKSHVRINDNDVSSLNSILTYTALLRSAVSIDFEKHGFKDEAIYTSEHHTILKDAARYQKYDLLDQLP